jgi:hypothetical protein
MRPFDTDDTSGGKTAAVSRVQSMITPAMNVVLLGIASATSLLGGFAETGPRPVVQEARPGPTSSKDGTKSLVVSGRVVDGLGRSVSGVTVTATLGPPRLEQRSEAVLQTGDDGRFSGTIARKDEAVYLSFKKDGYSDLHALAAVRGGADVTLNRKIRWDEVSRLEYRDGDKLDQGMREMLASEEWGLHDDKLLGYLFKHQSQFRPALRRILQDAHVGRSARNWLDLLGDVGDRDLFPKGRQFAPKDEVKETDLVEALKATARHRNFFSSKAEPDIELDFIAFTKDMDRVMIQCGINVAALTGVIWRFVFHKVDNKWVLRSAQEVGRG